MERGFLLAEDEALKAKLSNVKVTVPNPSGPGSTKKRARVWYGMPQQETERSYPFITIDLLDVVFAADRAHSAQLNSIDYWPSEYPSFAEWAAAQVPPVPFDPDENFAFAREFHPYNLIYQVTTNARALQHDREMSATLMGTAYLPDRWGYLHVPADASERHLVREDFSSADYYEGVGRDRKRVFRKVYTLSVTAEFPPENPFIYYQVLAVHGSLVEMTDPTLAFEWVNP